MIICLNELLQNLVQDWKGIEQPRASLCCVSRVPMLCVHSACVLNTLQQIHICFLLKNYPNWMEGNLFPANIVKLLATVFRGYNCSTVIV